MRVKIMGLVIHDGVEYQPGTIADFEEDAAGRLVRLKAAVPVENEETNDLDVDDMADMAEQLCKIEGVNNEVAYNLIEAGFKTIQSVAEAVPEDLVSVKGIGKKSVKKIQESAEELNG